MIRCGTRRTGDRRAVNVAGFTILEMIIVISIIGILATIALPQLKLVPRRAQEAVLRSNLHTMRDTLNRYYADTGSYPASLEALEEDGYLQAIPRDITKSQDTWLVEYDEPDFDLEPAETDYPEGGPGIIDVFSGSEAIALDGSSYRDW